MSNAAIVWCILAAISWGTAAAKHGEPQDDYNIWITTAGIGLGAAVLYWGGFFS